MRDILIDADGNDKYPPALCNYVTGLRTALTAAETRVKERDIALCSLTPGGSEYVGDPAACVAYVRKVHESQHDTIMTFKRERDTAQAALEEARKDTLRVNWIVLQGMCGFDDVGYGEYRHYCGYPFRNFREVADAAIAARNAAGGEGNAD